MYANHWVFGVCDGHGLFGHHASSMVKRLLPKAIFKKGKKNHVSTSVGSKMSKNIANGTSDSTSFNPSKSELLNKNISAGFKHLHQNMEDMKCPFDASFSGTTVNLVFINSEQKKLVCANAGDSRSVLYSIKPQEAGGQSSDDVNTGSPHDELDKAEWEITPLSDDHKPDLPKEHERITKKFGGRVLSYLDGQGKPVGPARVWLKNQNIPGLAMSRSIGDIVAHSVGVE